MKCFVLAGGSSDRLWPLSRKNFPKQFMELRNHRSMFQETVLRNIPFCDEFFIFANRRHESIIQGQLQAFQGLNYSFFFEDEPMKTALPVTMALLLTNRTEEILIVSVDSVLEGDYNATLIELKERVAQGKACIVGATVTNAWEGYNFIEYQNDCVLRLLPHRTVGNLLWDCGILAGRADVLLQAIDEKFLESCRMRLSAYVGGRIRTVKGNFLSYSLGQVLKTQKLNLLKAKFEFYRIVDLKTYSEYKDKKEKDAFSLKTACRNTDVINTEKEKAVVLNDVENLLVVNTRDAIYISKKESVATIKDIASQHYQKNPDLFDKSDISYYSWGIKTTLYVTHGYRVDKITLYPRREIPTQSHTRHTVGFSILRGEAYITLNEKRRKYSFQESVHVPVGSFYRIENNADTPLTIIETVIGQGVLEEDTERVADEVLIKLKPALKQCLWGGTNLKRLLGKNLYGKKNVGESWELSTHFEGESLVADGKYKGKTLREFIQIIGKEKLGWKYQAFPSFPLLIKFIDANQSLSVQVHPDDEYAFSNENEYGKNEMWYVVAAKEDAFIYAGFNQKVTKEALLRRLKDGTVEEILQKIPVQAGQTYFLSAGTVHAIGKGCVICEIQQNSNLTYRLYDYNRTDDAGKKRELHVEKALQVINFNAFVGAAERTTAQEYGNGYKTLLGECKYFSAVKYEATDTLNIEVDYSSFRSFVILEGEGVIRADGGVFVKRFRKGDTFFGVAREYIFQAKGKICIIAVNI